MASISRRQWFGGLLCGVSALVTSWPGEAEARRRTRVEWSEVKLPDDARQKKRQALLRKVLAQESRRADWGRHKSGVVRASVTVTQFQVVRRDDVMRVTCTAVGKLEKGPSARTHFSFGGHPDQQDKLEQTILTLIGRGIVTRLAALARQRAKRQSS